MCVRRKEVRKSEKRKEEGRKYLDFLWARLCPGC